MFIAILFGCMFCLIHFLPNDPDRVVIERREANRLEAKKRWLLRREKCQKRHQKKPNNPCSDELVKYEPSGPCGWGGC